MSAPTLSPKQMADTVRVILENARIAVEVIAACAQDAGNQQVQREAMAYRQPLDVRLAESTASKWNPKEPGIYDTLEGLSRLARDLWNPAYKDLTEWIMLKVVSDAGKAIWYQKALDDPKYIRFLEEVQRIKAVTPRLKTEFLSGEPQSVFQKMVMTRNEKAFEGIQEGLAALEVDSAKGARGVARAQAALQQKLPAPDKSYASIQELLGDLTVLKQLDVGAPAQELVALCEHANQRGTSSPDLTKTLSAAWKKASPFLSDKWVNTMSETIASIVGSTAFDTLSSTAAEAVLAFTNPPEPTKAHDISPIDARKEYRGRRESAESDLDKLLDASPALRASLSQKEYTVVKERLIRAMATQKKASAEATNTSTKQGPTP